MSDSMPLQETMGVGVLVVDDQRHFRRVALEVVGATPGFVPVEKQLRAPRHWHLQST